MPLEDKHGRNRTEVIGAEQLDEENNPMIGEISLHYGKKTQESKAPGARHGICKYAIVMIFTVVITVAVTLQTTKTSTSPLSSPNESDEQKYGSYVLLNATNKHIQAPHHVSFLPSNLMSERIQRFMQHIEPEFQTICEKILRGKPASFSQGWQDWYMYHNYFKGRDWGDGFYIDFGTNDPLTISNTAFLDKCLGWKGVCVEMNPRYHGAIRKKRGCSLVATCVLGTAKEVGMVDQGSGSSVSENGRGTKCTTFDSVIKQHNISHIDFVSIDIEGAEASTLRCLDMSRYDVDFWLVETNKQDQHQVDFFFQKNGYANSMSFFNAVENHKENWFIDSLYEKRPGQRPELPEVAPCDADSKPYMSKWCAPFQEGYRPGGRDDPWVCKP
eukprot:gnl/TRDRNA2_/TRDRNA2_30350_c0_seq1.p1 gnl/TRDRNA2_/TRDRNA2_30350_c0~~gnl/TRDRNA2_/TRDRNA2_30350_c0_seq1.p1  ORF type:complete len:386 (+),score=32.85 gnl/TRDRNA2_/TRDRNA2_30350_c0_seq1:100-1257(+)